MTHGITRWLAIFAAVLALAACGGGGGSDAPLSSGPGSGGTNPPSDGGSNPPSTNPPSDGGTSPPGNGGTNPPGNGGNNPPAAGAIVWEALSYTNDFTSTLTQLNAQGARGFIYSGGLILDGNLANARNIYVKDSNSTYSYEILPNQAVRANFLQQMNAQGARGFAFDGPSTVGTIYVKNNSGSSTYNYQLLDYTTTSNSFLTQANTQGASGFFYSGAYSFNSTEFVNIYTKVSGSNPVYAYRLDTYDDRSTSTFVTQANTQGQQGYAYIGSNIFPGDTNPDTRSRNMYVKDTTQSASFAWKALDYKTTNDSFLAQANAEGATGNYFVGAAGFFPNGTTAAVLTVNLYSKPTNCSGLLCRASGAL